MDEALRETCEHVFRYSSAPPPRRHGPRGYSDHSSYKPWLRDEFMFRCVYCLWRERWEADGDHGFCVDHVQPRSTSAAQRLDYDNLVYACHTCNATRRDVPLPMDPSNDPPGHHLQILGDERIEGTSQAGATVVELCRLNRPLLVAARRRIIALIAVLQASDDPEALLALRDLLAFPPDLPDLAALRPPAGNARPEGIADCFFARRHRGELADAY